MRRLHCLLLGFTLACDETMPDPAKRKPAVTGAEGTQAEFPLPSDIPDFPVVRDDPDLPSEPGGPAPASQQLTPQRRMRAVFDLLAGGEPAARLPLSDVDEGKVYRPQLRDQLAPPVLLGIPIVRMTVTRVLGSLQGDTVRRTLRQAYGRFRLCYERALERVPKFDAQLRLTFQINEVGRVTDLHGFPEHLVDVEMAKCVAGAHEQLEFPNAARKTTRVTHTIEFSIRH